LQFQTISILYGDKKLCELNLDAFPNRAVLTYMGVQKFNRLVEKMSLQNMKLLSQKSSICIVESTLAATKE
jgi:hypothetical protein